MVEIFCAKCQRRCDGYGDLLQKSSPDPVVVICRSCGNSFLGRIKDSTKPTSIEYAKIDEIKSSVNHSQEEYGKAVLECVSSLNKSLIKAGRIPMTLDEMTGISIYHFILQMASNGIRFTVVSKE